MSFFTAAADYIRKFFLVVRPMDFVDIIIVAYVCYKAIKLVRETRAVQLVKGLLVLVIVMQISHWLQLNTINYILRNTMQVGVVALLVVFQPELSRALEIVGRSNISNILNPADNKISDVADAISEAAESMSRDRVGALIVLERETRLGDIINSGTILNAAVSAPLLINIFVPNTPLHDGAVIIRGDIIVSASCILPLTHNDSLSRELGTRHRAALGVTENSDCVVVVVSEETGKISVATDGKMTRNLTPDALRRMIVSLMTSEAQLKKKDIKNWRERLSGRKNKKA